MESVTVVVACMLSVVFGSISGPAFPADADLVASSGEILDVKWLMDVADKVEEEFHGNLFLSWVGVGDDFGSLESLHCQW